MARFPLRALSFLVIRLLLRGMGPRGARTQAASQFLHSCFFHPCTTLSTKLQARLESGELAKHVQRIHLSSTTSLGIRITPRHGWPAEGGELGHPQSGAPSPLGQNPLFFFGEPWLVLGVSFATKYYSNVFTGAIPYP